jgi:signal transduction histidine kinase
MISPRFRNLVAAAWVLLFLVPVGGFPIELKKLDIPDDPRVLPYRFIADYTHRFPSLGFSKAELIDVDGDGLLNYVYMYSLTIDSGHFKSALLAFTDWSGRTYPAQYNGAYMSCQIWNSAALDLWGGPGKEIILTKHHCDTIILEIVSFAVDEGGIGIDTAVVLPAAIGRNMSNLHWWHSIHVVPLAALDLDGDGSRELVYSRIAKPDSLIARGIVAYDLKHNQPLWFFPTADLTSEHQIQVFKRPDGSQILVIATASCSNRYESNGMDSHHSYLFALDAMGHELWRTTLGSDYWSPCIIPMDVNGDGLQEICVPGQPGFPDKSCDTVLRAYDPWTGATVASIDSLPGVTWVGLLRLWDTGSGGVKLLLFGGNDESDFVFQIAQRLKVEFGVEGITAIQPVLVDLIGDGQTELLCGTRSGQLMTLNSDYEVLAQWPDNSGVITSGLTSEGPRMLQARQAQDFDMLRLEPQPLSVRLWAGYHTEIEIVSGALVIFLLIRGIAIMRRWRLAALGVPTLNRIDAMVLLLDAKGKILFANHHDLTDQLLGKHNGRRLHYLKSELVAHTELKEALDQSFRDPMGVQQHLVEVLDGSVTPRRLQVTIYPHVDDHNSYLGKIAVCEELTGKRARQWKLVMGEAAQHWVHRLKHNIGTARMVLGNIADDETVSEKLQSSPAFRSQWDAADQQILEGSRTATRILRFLSNPLPNKTACDISNLIELALDARRAGWSSHLQVSFLRQNESPTLTLDRDQILEVIDNLLSNAEKAITGAGQITVRTRLAEDLQDGQRRSKVEISFEDTGCGIAEDDLPHIFEPGFSRSPGGSGIGLPLVREIVENHGGTVAAESKVGQGSRFVVTLPL